MQLVPCPDGGKCGNSKHRQDSHSYKWCLSRASAGKSHSKSAQVTSAPASTFDMQKQKRARYFKLVYDAEARKPYRAADSYVTKDMVIPEEFVQAYINDPSDINDMSREEWEEDIRERIQENSADILAKMGIDEDDLDDGEFDMVMEAVYDADRSDIAGAMAKNMKPRTFTHYCGSARGGSEDAFREAMSKYEVGSDEWYDTLAEGYHLDLTSEHLTYSGPVGRDGGKRGADDRKAIASALKQALGDMVDEIDESYYEEGEMPGIEVVWTGNLSDVGPNDEDGSSEKLHILAPHLIFSYQYEGIASDPVQLRGEYVIDLPGRGRRARGFESDILDDMSRKRMRCFDYPDGVGLDQYAAKSVFRTR